MDILLKEKLSTSLLKKIGDSTGGCINRGQSYQTDNGNIFVKTNRKAQSRVMFDGEYASLAALRETNQVIDNPEGGAMLVMEHLNIHSLSSFASKLGRQLANLHKKNMEIKSKVTKASSSVHGSEHVQFETRFGFDIPTCCGFLPQSNTWCTTWEQFYANKIEEQISMLEKSYGNRTARDLWSKLLVSFPRFFHDLDIQPALLHGDLWGGNVGQDQDGPVIFDPASFYGHSEFDLAISQMFGGFDAAFFTSYFEILPKQNGYEMRSELYQLFHNLNHWNHFGGSYKSSSLSILKELVNRFN